MQTQSDMERIIKVAEVFLDIDVKISFSLSKSVIVSHPLFDSQYMMVPKSFDLPSLNIDNVHLADSINDSWIFDILESPAALKLGKEIKKKHLHECKEPAEVIWMISKEYRFEFLKTILRLLSEKDFAEVFRITWTSCNITNKTSVFTKKELTDLFSKCVPEYLMSEEELEAFRNFPDELTVYRGVNQLSQKNVRAFSWTLSPEVAERFANRFQTDDRIIYRANINKKDVFAYFAGGEAEIIVNPSKLKKVTAL